MKSIFSKIRINYRKITSKSLSRKDFLDKLLLDLKIPHRNIYFVEKQEAEFGGFAGLSAEIIKLLDERGIKSLYRHQTDAIALAVLYKDIVISTQTASGKTMCYNLPVLQNILNDGATTALYLFPTKALAHDQLTKFNNMSHALFGKKFAYAYDGDTDKISREKARKEAKVLITNPDMLHVGILPNHKEWKNFFANLKYIVVDELHTYRGVFGSHVANLFIRLLRICHYYGANPTFICATATIANPLEHAEALTGRKMQLVDKSRANTMEKIVAIYDPQKEADENRKDALCETAKLATKAICHGISTIVFARSRIATEILLQTIKKQLEQMRIDEKLVMSYRGGYLPNERRKIERDLRSGKLLCVVSTNALELGIDIGSLSCAILYGFPPTIASTWQEIGRAGRRGEKSYAIIVATKFSKDQFFAKNPSMFFEAPPEKVRIDSGNPYILLNHLKCATYELPFFSNETFGNLDVSEMLDKLASSGKILKVTQSDGAKYLWQGASPPAMSISLRSATGKSFTIRDISNEKKPKTVGTMDEIGATTLLFPGAIYLHAGASYKVENINVETKQCLVRPFDANYYTIGQTFLEVGVTNVFEGDYNGGLGDAIVTITPSTYKKLELQTHKILAVEEIHLPKVTLATRVTWLFLPIMEDVVITSFTLHGLEHILKLATSYILMCDMNDVILYATKNDTNFNKPIIYIIDNAQGGVGLAEGAREDIKVIIATALAQTKNCNCKFGCPACISVMESEKEKSKIIKILEQLYLTFASR
ncbi:MAG: DEAD/DEAH box helicase [Synergistaceae bacterium]|nr:DEAD/DEAH box helicase [Synergistaceae bacterium]